MELLFFELNFQLICGVVIFKLDTEYIPREEPNSIGQTCKFLTSISLIYYLLTEVSSHRRSQRAFSQCLPHFEFERDWCHLGLRVLTHFSSVSNCWLCVRSYEERLPLLMTCTGWAPACKIEGHRPPPGPAVPRPGGHTHALPEVGQSLP